MSSLIEGVGLILGLLGVFSALGAVVFRPARRLVRKVSGFLDDWAGEPARPGVPARLGVMERLSTIEANQVTVRQESKGTRDAVQRALMQQEKRTSAVLADLDVNLAEAKAHIETIHKELTPNGGGSIKDQVSRLDRTLNPAEANDIAEEH